jgi:tryptophan aminotransferase
MKWSTLTPTAPLQLAGKPNPETFPFQSMTLRLKPPLDGTSLQNGHADANGDGDGVTGNEDGSVTLELDGDDMHEALQ